MTRLLAERSRAECVTFYPQVTAKVSVVHSQLRSRTRLLKSMCRLTPGVAQMRFNSVPDALKCPVLVKGRCLVALRS